MENKKYKRKVYYESEYIKKNSFIRDNMKLKKIDI